MPLRSQPLPEATTESAREARKAFFCELCQKGYARMTDFEGHENSYDHQHRKRLKEMRQMTRDPNAAAKARLAEERANEEAGLRAIVGSVDLGAGGGAGERKKRPVFKSTLQPHNAVEVTGKPQPPAEYVREKEVAAAAAGVRTEPAPSFPASTIPITPSTEIPETMESGERDIDENMQADDAENQEDEEKEFIISFDFEEEDDENLGTHSEGTREWWTEQYRPLNGATELRDVIFMEGQMRVV